MSHFACTVERLKIEPHPNADAIEIARIGDYQSIVKKGQFRDGDLGVYIPEQAVLPRWLLEKMGFWNPTQDRGTLSGSLGNRVRAIKLRGVLSQGIVLDGTVRDLKGVEHLAVSTEGDEAAMLCEGEDAAAYLGIVKYEPPLPTHMQARVVGVDYGATHNYDFDNLKKKPSLFDDGEPVVITEKIHGTFMQIGVVPSSQVNEKYFAGRVIVSSKGMGAKGYVLDHNDETNLYAQAAKRAGLFEAALRVLGPLADECGRPVFVMGEVFGKTLSGAGVQDLTYNGEELAFRAFDICVGNRGAEQYLTWEKFKGYCQSLGVRHVPVLYEGPYSKDVVLQHTDGPTTLVPPRGTVAHIREGVVVKSAIESSNPHYGRKIAKSVSEAYLLRKGNVTEFQ
jgi:RNA ligase (TIGR02306 family)